MGLWMMKSFIDGVPKYYLNYQEMLAAAEIEAVSITTPDHLHRK
jgi:predicted dehydrogenase